MIRAVRRSLFALSLTGLVALFLRFQGENKATTPHQGGWRELSGPDLR
jgi:hypothetical protein